MRIGRQDAAFTAIASSNADTITVRGYDLCADLIGRIDFTDYFWLLVTGARPNDKQRTVTNACLVAIAEHGLVPSVQASRMTLAAAPEAWQGAMAAGLLGMGSVVAGSSEIAGRYIADVLKASRAPGSGMETAARESLEALKAARGKVPGLGHPQHSAGDPRANALLALADRLGVSGDHVGCLRIIAKQAPNIMNRALPVNVSGAIPALMLDAGWPLEAIKGIPLLARAAGLVAHLFEESQRSIGFILSHHADLAIEYDGEPANTAAGPEHGS
jgi:citrate synthase